MRMKHENEIATDAVSATAPSFTTIFTEVSGGAAAEAAAPAAAAAEQ